MGERLLTHFLFSAIPTYDSIMPSDKPFIVCASIKFFRLKLASHAPHTNGTSLLYDIGFSSAAWAWFDFHLICTTFREQYTTNFCMYQVFFCF
jgi:hypothetical protein